MLAISGRAQVANQFGFLKHEIEENLDTFFKFPHLKVTGLMTIAPFNKSEKEIQSSMKEVFSLFKEIKKTYSFFENLSMGMSNDYKLAILEGSTLIRVGRILL